METDLTDNCTDEKRGYTFVLDSPYIMTGKEYYEKFTSARENGPAVTQPDQGSMLGLRAGSAYSGVPEKIQGMLALYEYGDVSFRQKCLNFVRQGMFMKDYEDSAPWYGDLRSFFPVYHDLNIRQLRGYFTWRTQIRKGRFSRTCEAFVYIYVYELLNGIGTGSPEESFEKLEKFYGGYVDTGMGDPVIRKNLRRWLREFAVIHDFPKEAAARYSDPGAEERARALAVLRDPAGHTDEEIFMALSRFSSPKFKTSPVILKGREHGVRLFAEVWRHLPADVFTSCFGAVKTSPWHPLAGAVYLETRNIESLDYDIDECRQYTYRGGVWQETCYDRLSADQNAFLSIMHMTDLKLRRQLKTGHYLRQKHGEEQAEILVDAAIQEMQKEAAEAARPKITIDLSGLDKIRDDAAVTCDSLLTDEERGEDCMKDIFSIL